MLRNAEQLDRVLQDVHESQTITYLGLTYLEDATFAEQVCMFAEVSILIGVHGQALANLLWMEPGSTVVELMHTGQWWYSDLAAAKGVRFIGLLGNPPEPVAFQSALASAVRAWQQGSAAAAEGAARPEL